MNGAARLAPRRRPPLALICMTLFILILPLTLSRSWLPKMHSDEAAYYLGALSLWHDGDFAYDDGDARRLFREYPGTDNLKLTIGSGEPKAHFGVPLVYPLVTMPMVALFGAKGMIAVNAALLMAMVWMAFFHLRRHNSDSVSTLFAVGFFFASTAFVYVFWVQAEILNMFCVMTAFYLVERTAGSDRGHALSIAGSGALLAIACYGKPMLAVLALPLLYRLTKTRSRRAAASFAAAAVVCVATLGGATLLATGHVWPYFAPRTGVELHNPVRHVERTVSYRDPRQESLVPADRLKTETNKLKYTFFPNLRTSVPEFLVGRHGGFLFYMPFAVVALLVFFLRERRSVFGWLILGSAALAALLFITLIQGHWLGGGGFSGNRYFVSVYPAFLFLVRRIRPRWLIALGYAAAALFLGPMLIRPLGPQPEFGPQAHAANPPFPELPLEWSLVNTLLGDYWSLERPGVAFHGRRNEIRPRGPEIWVIGAQRVEINLLTGESKRAFTFDVRNLAPGNRVEICLELDCRELFFDDVPVEGETQRVTFAPRDGNWIPRAGRDQETFRYRMTIETEWGEAPRWRGSDRASFYLGAALELVGSPENPPGAAAESDPTPAAEGAGVAGEPPADSTEADLPPVE